MDHSNRHHMPYWRFVLHRVSGGSGWRDRQKDMVAASLGVGVLFGVGAQGLSGNSTAFAVHLELAATHITMNPVAVNIQCHSARRASARITPEGVIYGF